MIQLKDYSKIMKSSALLSRFSYQINETKLGAVSCNLHSEKKVPYKDLKICLTQNSQDGTLKFDEKSLDVSENKNKERVDEVKSLIIQQKTKDSKYSEVTRENAKSQCEVKTKSDGPRINALNVQVLSQNLYHQIFGESKTKEDPTLVWKAQKELKRQGLWRKEVDILPDVNLQLPKLLGENIEDHFKIIGEEQAGPYRKLILDFMEAGIPEKPEVWVFQKGWTKYVMGKEPESVPFPDETALVFDVEVCLSVGEGPTLATAVSSSAWYAWICPDLIDDVFTVSKKLYDTKMMIPLEGKNSNSEIPRIVIGHNVSYDRARVKEQYYIKNSMLRFLDTMSMHICISGITSSQRMILKKANASDSSTEDRLCANSLQDVYQFYCKKSLQKDDRKLFINGTLKEIKDEFQKVMNYCADDVLATYEVLLKIGLLFFERFPHPVTLAGMLELGTAYLPVNKNWNRYISDSEQTYEDLQNETIFLLARKCNRACQLLHDEKYKQDLWMWNEDWSTQDLKLTKKKIKSNIPPESSTSNRESDEWEEDNLKNKFQYLFEQEKILPKVSPHLPGYPAWYRHLCNKNTAPDWVPGPQLVTTSIRVTPKLLNLTWENYPLFHKREHGWGILVADLNVFPGETQIPFEKLKNLTLQNNKLNAAPISNGESIEEDLILNLSKKMYWKQLEKTNKSLTYQGKGIWCGVIVEDCCHFLKLPHKNGPNYNVGNPLARDFITKFSTSTLSSSDAAAEKVLSIARMLSYWKNSKLRITGQLVVSMSSKEMGVLNSGEEEALGVILPLVVVSGTLTRRAVEPTWMTASNAQEERIGSELRAMVQAPSGYHFVGADVDSQELWIAALLSDSHFAKIHGATPFGWMTLSGSKACGTDLHSVTAKAVGISRDEAKVLNYARIYGAGWSFAVTLLKQFNPSMSDQDAKSKALKMFRLTKGNRVYRVKDGFEIPGNESKVFNYNSAKKVTELCNRNMSDIFGTGEWIEGTESSMFNSLEVIANSDRPTTPFLGCRITRALEPKENNDRAHMTTRVNWVVQSSAVDFLHLMLVCMRWLTNGQARFSLSFHDEVRYLIPSEKRYQTALALHITNLLTRAFFSRRVGLDDLPQSVAFFSSVEVDKVLRKEANNNCVTASNPHGLENGYGIAKGESLDIHKTIELSGGNLSTFSFSRYSILEASSFGGV